MSSQPQHERHIEILFVPEEDELTLPDAEIVQRGLGLGWHKKQCFCKGIIEECSHLHLTPDKWTVREVVREMDGRGMVYHV